MPIRWIDGKLTLVEVHRLGESEAMRRGGERERWCKVFGK